MLVATVGHGSLTAVIGTAATCTTALMAVALVATWLGDRRRATTGSADGPAQPGPVSA